MMTRPDIVSRRSVLAAAAGLLALPAAGARARAVAAAPRVAALDWPLARTLLDLGAPPVAATETAAYAAWVGGPPLPAETVDVGLRLEPNKELLLRLRPDLILASDEHALLVPQLERIAPVLVLSPYTEERAPLRRAVAATRLLGARLGRRAAAEALVAAAEAEFSAARRALRGDRRPVVVVNFMDARHLRVYGDGSLAADVLARLGLPQGWRGDTNLWGFATIPMESLAAVPEARLAVIEPLPAGVREGLAGSRLWQGLPMVRAGRVSILPRTMMFGMVSAAGRLARLLRQEMAA